ncbi:MAG: phosphoribosylamine--glycine ligase [Lentisphaeria bacterium]|nr:phosphoribosylamine--glycine ligase [Lentisphaeria bacterium]
MNILVIGSGGREHAIAWKMKQSAQVEQVFVAPGNPLWAGLEAVNLDILDFPGLISFCKSNAVGLTMVGPEVPLCEGIVDAFRAEGLKIFGPNQEAAQLEGSKAYAKTFMFKHGIPTADSKTFTELAPALAYAQDKKAPLVVKADGLAAGKGVIVAMDQEELEEGIRSCFSGSFGVAGERVVLEEFLDGEEASILAFIDGKTIKSLASSQDHKRRFEGDQGPNTGGMGAYSPAPVVDVEMMAKIDTLVLQPFLKGCQIDNLDFRGIVFIGIMIDAQGQPKVLEFNVRFGDPETEAVLPRLESDLTEAMLATVDGTLESYEFKWSSKHAVSVILASGGYPSAYDKGLEISGISEAEETGALVFQAGTKLADEKTLTNGGRVLAVTALADSIDQAVKEAYQAVDCISWDGMVYRKDIAYRALNR